jgi:hypothetical protein
MKSPVLNSIVPPKLFSRAARLTKKQLYDALQAAGVMFEYDEKRCTKISMLMLMEEAVFEDFERYLDTIANKP